VEGAAQHEPAHCAVPRGFGWERRQLGKFHKPAGGGRHHGRRSRGGAGTDREHQSVDGDGVQEVTAELGDRAFRERAEDQPGDAGEDETDRGG